MERKRETRASGLEEEKEDKELEEGGKTKQDKMEGLEENEDNKSLHADKVDDETFYNDSFSLAFEVESEKGRWFDPEFKDGYKVCGEYMRWVQMCVFISNKQTNKQTKIGALIFLKIGWKQFRLFVQAKLRQIFRFFFTGKIIM